MIEYGMGDDATIDEIMNDVETDKVIIYTQILIICTHIYIFARVCICMYIAVVFLQMTEVLNFL